MLGKIIKEYTTEHDISAREFARHSGLSHTHISQIINGKEIDPCLSTLRKIARAMNMSLLCLLVMAGYVSEKEKWLLPGHNAPFLLEVYVKE